MRIFSQTCSLINARFFPFFPRNAFILSLSPRIFSMLLFKQWKSVGTKACASSSKESCQRERSFLAGSEKEAPELSKSEDNSKQANHTRVFEGTCEEKSCLQSKCKSTCPTLWKNVAHLTHGKPFPIEAWKKHNFISSEDGKKENNPQFMISYENPRSLEKDDIEVNHLMTGFVKKNQETINAALDQEKTFEK